MEGRDAVHSWYLEGFVAQEALMDYVIAVSEEERFAGWVREERGLRCNPIKVLFANIVH